MTNYTEYNIKRLEDLSNLTIDILNQMMKGKGIRLLNPENKEFSDLKIITVEYIKSIMLKKIGEVDEYNRTHR